jgi:dGTPase
MHMTNNNFQRILDLLKEDRLRGSTRGQRGILIASESDKGRVINSAAFRRLQQKAQVFPLEPNAAVRTRLTHSIEVSQIGRHIAQKVIEEHGATDNNSYSQLAAFVNTIETACLLHDIGNPPFGHFGEAAIRDWFKKRSTKIDDLLNFDGNPQGFRIASFLSGADEYGFNLTCTLLLSIIKYPVTSEDKAKNESLRKIGLFDAECDRYKKACEKLSWEPKRRFPFVFLMDAADDIAYSMSDLEDGLEKKIVSIDDLAKVFGEEHLSRAAGKNALDPFINFKTKVITDAAALVAKQFVANLDAILSGKKVTLLPESSDVGELINRVKSFAMEHIYTDSAAEQIELAGQSVISGLLDHFGILLDLDKQTFVKLISGDSNTVRKEGLDIHIRLLRRIPRSYRDKYLSFETSDETARRAHLLVDYISGMTDDFALETYQILEGIRIR